MTELTIEQIKSIRKARARARFESVFAVLKALTMLFGANLACFYLGIYFLKDCSDFTKLGFHLVTVFTNSIFAAIAFSSDSKISSDKLKFRIEEIVNIKTGEKE